MIRAAFAAIVLVLAAGIPGGAAKADPHPWCAMFTGPLGGANNCTFVTFEQCLATVSGVGGHCAPNPWYSRGTPRTQRPSRRR